MSFTTTGSDKAKALVVRMTMWSQVMPDVPVFTYEVDAVTAACGTLSLAYEPGTPYEAVTGLNGWVDTGACGGNDLVTAKADGFDITWTVPLSSTTLKKGAKLSGFAARVDVSNPAVPFPSSTTQTGLGLVDSATGKGTWKLT